MYRVKILSVQVISTSIRNHRARTKLTAKLPALLFLVGAVFLLLSSTLAPAAQAQTPSTFKHDFLYKFWSYWSDVTTDGAYLYVTNSAYSQVDKYNLAGVHQTSNWGGYGLAAGKFKQPQGVYFVGTDLYVADTGNNRIQRIDTTSGVPSGPPYSWGSYGANPGQFNSPYAVAVDSAQAYLFVADTGNNRIQAIEADTGAVASVAGTLGSGINQFSSPKGIAVKGTSPSLTVYVADTGNNRFVEYEFNTSSGVFNYRGMTGSYGTVTGGTFNQPTKIHVDSSEYIYVTDTTNRIQKFDNGRNFLRQWDVNDKKGTTGLTSWGGTLYVVEPYHQIDAYNAQFGIFSSSFSNESNQPVDVATDLNGNIYINNNTTNTVEKFNSSWVPQAEWGGNSGAFSSALGIGVNTGGEVVVADTGNNRAQRFDTNGTFQQLLITPAVTPAGFNGLKDVAMESTGKMYVADTNNNRIIKIKSDNTFDWAIGLPTPVVSVDVGTPTPVAPTGPYFDHPYGITVDSQNKIYVADSGHNRILKFDANGAVPTGGAAAWGEYGAADDRPIPQFDNPQGMAIEETGTLGQYYIYVADTGNNRIQRFDQDGVKDPTRDVWGVYGTGDGQFNQPRNISLDTSKRIYVSEVLNRRVQVFGDATLNAGLSITQTDGTAVTEDGSVTDSYTVKLNTQPTQDVRVDITSSDSAQLTVSSPSLTFTPYNWNVPQVVTVLPVHDYVDQPTTQSIVLSHTTTSYDSNYNSGGVSVASVQVTLTDTDTYGVTFSKTSVNVTEEGSTDSYTVVLNTKPDASVNLTITSADGQTLSNNIDPLTLNFTTSNWNTPQTVAVSAVHDNIDNGAPRDSYINFAIETADTTGYATAVLPGNFVAHITDSVNDVARVILSTASLSLLEQGPSQTYTVQLNTKPLDNVTIEIATPEATADLTISPSTLTFAPDGFNVPQTVTVTAINDNIKNIPDPRHLNITHTASSTDPNYGPSVPYYVGGSAGTNVIDAAITDANERGLKFSKASANLIEGQVGDTYDISLLSKPSSNVTLAISRPAAFEATSSAYVYTFTPEDWNVPQTVTLTSANNNIYEGTHSANFIHTVLTSTDANYAPGNQYIFPVNMEDTDNPGILLTLPNGALNVTEFGIDDMYYVRLKTQPASDVTVTMNGGTQLTASPSSMVFTSANWNQDQIATVSAINDYVVEGAHTAPLIHTASSSDPNYNSGITASVTVNITDDDNTVPGVQIVQPAEGVNVNQSGQTSSYTMVLTSKPTAYVRIKVLGDNWAATTSAALFTFLPTNWNVPQTVNVKVKDGPNAGTTTTFRHLVSSLDPHYNGTWVEDVLVHVGGFSLSAASAAKAPTCSATPPYDKPNLFQINSRSNSATLYFTPIRDNISYYFIAYGYTPGDIRFGTSFNMGSYDGVIDYTVNMLNPGETYYFKVRGGNGCATGEWGNTLSATTTASGSASTRVSYASSTATSWASASTGSSGGTSSGGSSGATHPIFVRDFYLGTRGADVRSLQMYLNQQGYTIAQSGPGSPGNETDLYGPLTANAVRRLQEANYAAILSPLGYSSGTGIFGPSTRNWVNSH